MVLTTSAIAQSTAAAHMAAGVAAQKKQDWAKALTQFQAAEDIRDTIGARAGVADAEFNLGADREAYDHYQELGARLPAQARTKGDVQLRKLVNQRLRLLLGRMGEIHLTLVDPNATVFVDAERLGTSPMATTVHVTAGKHRVHAERGDGATAEDFTDVGPGATIAVQLHLVLPHAAPTLAVPSDAGVDTDAGEESAAAVASAAPATEKPPPGSQGEPWTLPHGSTHYVAVVAKTPPKIDGVLDDPIWKQAPRDSHFLSTTSKPYGQPTQEPTTVQVAYDSEYLYVAFWCGYSGPRPRDDSFTTDEPTTAATTESVGVYVDPLHDHANALGFVVSRIGARADVELTNNGADPNIDWTGIWDVATQHSATEWTAEYRIPWGTMRMPAHSEPFEIGVNFRRREPMVGEFSLWSLEPPAAPGLFDTTYFGHLEGLEDVHPKLRLYLQPYGAIAFDQRPGTFRSNLYDFTGTQSNLRIYGGLYARYYPPGPFRVEATINPDFSAVPPDQAVANFDRFELLYPEARPFFSEDNPRFSFGVPGQSQLFYSRRVGLKTDPVTGATSPVPIIYGAKALMRTSSTEASVMNIESAPPDPKVAFSDNVTVARVTQTFNEGRRVGAIFLGRTGSVGEYAAGGADGVFTLYERHLILSGFLARTATQGAASSGMGQAQLTWLSQDFTATTSYTDIGSALDAQLGYVPVTGIRSNYFEAAYTPVIDADLVQQLSFDANLNLTRDRTDVRVFDRANATATAYLINGGEIQVQASPAIENVAFPFPLFAGRLTIPRGQYDVMVLQAAAYTAPRAPVVFGAGYLAGDLFDGQRQAPFVNFGLNLGRFAETSNYQLFIIRYNNQSFVGHQVGVSAAYNYTPLAKTTLNVQANTLIERAVAQLVTSYTFGQLSTVSLVISKSTGSVDVPTTQWASPQAPLTAILSFAYGISPF
ncbi:MAG: DUF5916 domain-containing protein [Polyangiaceae bacterium]